MDGHIGEKKQSTDEQMEINVFHCRAKAKLLDTSKRTYAQKSLSSIHIDVLQHLILKVGFHWTHLWDVQSGTPSL